MPEEIINDGDEDILQEEDKEFPEGEEEDD